MRGSRRGFAGSAALLLLAVLGCGREESRGAHPDAGGDEDAAAAADGGTPAGTTVSGTVVAERDGAGPFPFAGATVTVVGAIPPVEATSAADGTFTLAVDPGIVWLRATGAGHWGVLGGGVAPPAGLARLDLELTPDAAVDEIGRMAGRTVSPARGAIVVHFSNPSPGGGERVTISAASDPAIVVTRSGVIESDTLTPDTLPLVIFTNVAPGTTAITASGVMGTNDCAVAPIEIPAWPVEANIVTSVRAECR